MEETKIPSVQSHGETVGETTLSQDIDQNTERVKEVRMKMEQLMARFGLYISQGEELKLVMLDLGQDKTQTARNITELGQRVAELGKCPEGKNELEDEHTTMKPVLKFGVVKSSYAALKQLTEEWEAMPKNLVKQNLKKIKARLEFQKRLRTEDSAEDDEMSHLKSAILPLLEKVKQDAHTSSTLTEEAESSVEEEILVLLERCIQLLEKSERC